jgi:Flp pilus assembly protein TadG
MKSNQRRGYGQSIVELTIMLPILLLFLVGALDLGRALQAYVVVNQAAREAARYGTINGQDVAGMTQVALDEIERGGLNRDAASVSVLSALTGSPVRVTVQYNFLLVTTFWSNDPVILRSTVEMVVL